MASMTTGGCNVQHDALYFLDAGGLVQSEFSSMIQATAPNHQGTAGKELAPSSGTPRIDGGLINELALRSPQPSMVPYTVNRGGYGFGSNLTHDGEGFGSRVYPAEMK